SAERALLDGIEYFAFFFGAAASAISKSPFKLKNTAPCDENNFRPARVNLVRAAHQPHECKIFLTVRIIVAMCDRSCPNLRHSAAKN
ncbi:MAG TPA: hypothetical protein VFE79_20165, partial [Paraburkholderia sp.]|nr:hypothetical protein [Paraburkholderia sp.]